MVEEILRAELEKILDLRIHVAKAKTIMKGDRFIQVNASVCTKTSEDRVLDLSTKFNQYLTEEVRASLPDLAARSLKRMENDVIELETRVKELAQKIIEK